MIAVARSLAVALVFILFGLLTAGQTAVEQEPIKGLTGVLVVLEDLPEPVAQSGLSTAALKALIEEKLKAAGIVVLSKEAWSNTPGTPTLYLTVNVNGGKGKGYYACSLNLTVAQRVTLDRDATIKTLARTWQKGIVGLVPDTGLSGVSDQALFLVGQFISDYYAVNPRSAG